MSLPSAKASDAARAFPQLEHMALAFAVGGERYSVALAEVAEIVELPPLRAVPGAPRECAHLFEHRGRVLTLLSPFPAEAGAALERALIFAPPYAHLALRAPAALETLDARDARPLPRPETTPPWVAEVVSCGPRLYHRLSAERLAGFARARVVEQFKQR